jgi:hypothetical protein
MHIMTCIDSAHTRTHTHINTHTEGCCCCAGFRFLNNSRDVTFLLVVIHYQAKSSDLVEVKGGHIGHVICISIFDLFLLCGFLLVVVLF